MDDRRQMVNRIKDEIAPEVMKRGVKNVSMDDIASKLGISKKTIYKFFSGKEELVETIVVSIMKGIIAKQEKLLKDAKTPIDKFYCFFLPILEKLSLLDKTHLWEILKYYPAVFKKVDETRRERLTKLVEIYSEGVESGDFRPVNPDLLLAFLQSSVLEFVTPEKMLKYNASPGEMIDFIMSTLFFGLVQDDRRAIFKEKFPGKLKE